ncbi:MAG: MBL fold metallo-hydrolase [Gemmatimonadaceae bacterium]
MLFKRFYDDNLAQASYLIACERTREAVVVDPNIDIAQYTRAAGAQRLRIAHVTETHIHADFVSGAHALAEVAGAALHLSAESPTEWGYTHGALSSAHGLKNGSEITFGAVRLRALHTPGHTPEHLVFLVSDLDRGDQTIGAFTGDFIFVGDVGRPDLLERAAGAAVGTTEAAARELFHSIHEFLRLPDFVQIWPGHGAGSACGRSLGAMPQSTLGYERLFNWALSQMDEKEFVRRVLEDQPVPPRYFARMKNINRSPNNSAPDAIDPSELPLSDLEGALRDSSTIVDTRPAEKFAVGHIPGTLNIPRTKSFLNWFGALVPSEGDVYLITEAESDDAVCLLFADLAKIGVAQPRGHFSHRIFHDWQAAHGTLERIPQVDAEALSALAGNSHVQVIDVRGPDEWRRGHLPGAIHIPLAALPERIVELDPAIPTILQCKGGGRSSIAASLLKARGMEQVSNLTGGFEDWVKRGLEVEREPAASHDLSSHSA